MYTLQEGDVIAYRLIELTASWTPELSSFRVHIKSAFGLHNWKKNCIRSLIRITSMSLQVGKISRYDAKSNRIWLEPVLEYPFDFKKKIDEDASSVQYNPSPYQENGSLEVIKLFHFLSRLFHFCTVAYIVGEESICPLW